MDCVLRLTACLYTQHSQTSDHKLRSQLAAFAEREKLQRITIAELISLAIPIRIAAYTTSMLCRLTIRVTPTAM
jgi:hypothetical protein